MADDRTVRVSSVLRALRRERAKLSVRMRKHGYADILQARILGIDDAVVIVRDLARRSRKGKRDGK